jgi:hypothetical protein
VFTDSSTDAQIGWPEDMAIKVVGGETHLMELLWIRHHAVANALPELPQADLPPVEGSAPASDDLVRRWVAAWKYSLNHTAEVQLADPRTMMERSDLWEAPRPTKLAEETGVDLSGVSSWRESLSHDGAERSVVDALRGAWEAGLKVIVELPLAGPYAKALSPEVLVVSSATRHDIDAYAQVLRHHA